jgi:hypothetical protein
MLCRISQYIIFGQKHFPRRSSRLSRNVENNGTATEATDSNITRRRKDVICLPDNKGNNTYTHSEYVTGIAAPLPKCFHENAHFYLIVHYLCCLFFLRKLFAMKKELKTSLLLKQTSLVAWWSELLITKHEVPGSIPGSAVGIFPCRGRSPQRPWSG